MTGGSPAVRGAVGRIRGAVLRVLILAACAAALVWTVGSLGPRRIAALALQADPFWLGLSLVAVAARYLIWAAKWNLMMRRQGPVGYALTLRAILSGTLVNLVTPTAKLAGGVLRAAIVQRRVGWRLSVAYGWSLADQVTNVLGDLALAALLAIGASWTGGGAAWREELLSAGGAVVGLIVLAIALRDWVWRQARRPGVARLASRFTPSRFRTEGDTAGWLEPLLAPSLRAGRAWRVLPLDLGLGALSWFALCVASVLVFRSLGTDVPLFETAAALVLAAFAGTLSGAVGGVGATEVVLIGLYTGLGVPADAAAAAALLHRATYYAFSLLFGAAALAYESRGARPESVAR